MAIGSYRSYVVRVLRRGQGPASDLRVTIEEIQSGSEAELRAEAAARLVGVIEDSFAGARGGPAPVRLDRTNDRAPAVSLPRARTRGTWTGSEGRRIEQDLEDLHVVPEVQREAVEALDEDLKRS